MAVSLTDYGYRRYESMASDEQVRHYTEMAAEAKREMEERLVAEMLTWWSFYDARALGWL
jgi:hypothetical protein